MSTQDTQTTDPLEVPCPSPDIDQQCFGATLPDSELVLQVSKDKETICIYALSQNQH